jgi:hypothetical protein
VAALAGKRLASEAPDRHPRGAALSWGLHLIELHGWILAHGGAWFFASQLVQRDRFNHNFIVLDVRDLFVELIHAYDLIWLRLRHAVQV